LAEENEREKAQLAEENEREKAQLAEEKDKSEALKDGFYYATISQVWHFHQAEIFQTDLDAIRRQDPHHFYRATYDAAERDDLYPAYKSGRSEYDPGSSLNEDEGDSRTEISRKKRLRTVTIDGSVREVAEVAHLIPYSPNCAHFYGPLAEAAVGVNVGGDTNLSPQKKKLKQLVLVHGQYKQENGSDKRVTDTGIKHCRTNMARVVAQKRYLDVHPSLLIVPILTLTNTLAYYRGEYRVLVACTDPSVYVETILQKEYMLCTADEIHTATTTLASFVKAVAVTLQSADPKEIDRKLDKNPEKPIILKTLKQLTATSPAQVKVPTVMAFSVTPRLAKLTLDMQDKDAHQECDPFLLFVKAAVVWSSIQDQKLLPACALPHDCDRCLEQGLFECECDAYDPWMPIPEEIHIRPET
jgi:hypothetical protein